MPFPCSYRLAAVHIRGLSTFFSGTRALDRLDACTERRAFAGGVAKVRIDGVVLRGEYMYSVVVAGGCCVLLYS